MAPPRKHETDAILDAARALVLAEGPRAASVAAIATASGAPVGTLYHRFGNRDGILAATWLRALDRFQSLAVAATADSAVETAVAMALSAITFARRFPGDARLLLTVRPEDLVDADGGALVTAITSRNAPLVERLRQLTRELYGADDRRSLDVLQRAVVDLPYAAVRRHVADVPDWLAGDLAESVRALLAGYRQ
ncbi:TetR family transcriptional regulator [uncultured Mycobacterium sp.]|uniref:TetR family transcriptional regulator n=1 Tax=uncultured Mycobacterium sp. TaxID=171292 RepID=A0A1Y5PI83_9MYCO|nr:TetR family transcriptional regulator [uncultured Mycobacterium sp.]